MIYTVFVKVVIKRLLARCAHAYDVGSCPVFTYGYQVCTDNCNLAVRSRKGAGKSTWGPCLSRSRFNSAVFTCQTHLIA